MTEHHPYIAGHFPGIGRPQATAISHEFSQRYRSGLSPGTSRSCNLPHAPAINRPLNSPALRPVSVRLETPSRDGGHHAA